ncbi:histone acetyltransferase catalytic subunit HAT1 [Lachancea thermotolerans CBS 6340]|uniref:Histone acetyltransferase type B catalytic subunit n=1 Tax=Lachancea thermotolerans (strain ATCC 56472 / CBS 6340 / NRRL Y-8284) TaxID=559295 RepID=C5DBF4_LACTC|nr:KLTH0A02178p [Lachancea thermotolerans CBS 6340]CAR21111.1 KLTH0A02178p [Lachancea thermotolerans CBS 6340]
MADASDLRPEAWTVSSNTAVKLSFVDEEGAVQFTPTFTYPIYGDSEQIFGYQDLQILLAFDSVTFKPFCNVKFGAKLADTDDNVQDKLLKYLPDGDVIVKDEIAWVDTFNKERESFTLPDESKKVASYSREGHNFAVYKVDLHDDNVKKLHRRMQIFTLFLIESASYIDEGDEGWELYMSFNTGNKQCVGYSTTYKYWKYMGARNFDSTDKTFQTGKISQFLVFPPYQGVGHGSELYNAIINDWLADTKVIEITVEDPNEDFDSLRDRNDLKRLYASGIASEIPRELPIKNEWIEAQRSIFKIEKRQFQRLIEMLLLHICSPNFRLQVKKRLYEKNYDLLADLDTPTRNDKLQTAFLSIKEEYDSILASLRFKRHEDLDNTQPSKKIKN